MNLCKVISYTQSIHYIKCGFSVCDVRHTDFVILFFPNYYCYICKLIHIIKIKNTDRIMEILGYFK